jgi:hypothetical protein
MDVKKLITGFLILATAAASSALILSNMGNVSARARAGSDVAINTVLSPANLNAFVPTQADVANAVAENDPNIAVALADPNNLTSNFTNVFLNSVSVANPTGLNTDGTGNAQIKTPDEQSVTAAFLKTSALKNVQAPDWDAEAAAIKIKISKSASSGSYGDAINATFSKNIIQTGVNSMVGQNSADPSALSTVTPAIQGALSDAVQTPTPNSLVNFQKSLVKMLVYQKNMLALAETANSDPVKAAILYQAEEGKYMSALQGFQSESQKAAQAKLFSFNGGFAQAQNTTNKLVAFLGAIVGVQTAHAQWLTFDASVFGEFLLDMINNIILQVLKNTITAFLQQRVLKWIQGSGAPRFIQQWGTTLANAYTQKAIASMSQVLANTCPNIGPLLKPIQTNLVNSIGGNNKVLSCPIPSASLSQVTNFYNNFNAPGVQTLQGGSWGLYADVLNPNGGNYFATLLGSSDYVNSQGSAAQQAATAKAQSNNGYKGDETCDDNGCDDDSVPSDRMNCIGGATVSQDEMGDYVCPDGSKPITVSQCADQTTPMDPATESANGVCADGDEPEVQTPGQTTLQAQYNSLGGALELTVNANSIGGVLASVATSFINTLVASAASYATKAATQGLTQITLSATAGGPSSNGGTTLTGSSIPPPPASSLPPIPPTTCSPHSPQCTGGPGGQCSSEFFGQTIDFSATGGDGLTYTWTVAAPAGIDTNVSSYSGPMFSPYFSPSAGVVDPATGVSTLSFPLTIPVTVTGSDGKSDTCIAVITQ